MSENLKKKHCVYKIQNSIVGEIISSKTLASSERICALSYPLTFVKINILLRGGRHLVVSSLLNRHIGLGSVGAALFFSHLTYPRESSTCGLMPHLLLWSLT